MSSLVSVIMGTIMIVWLSIWKFKNCTQQVVAKYDGYVVWSRKGGNRYAPKFSYEWNNQQYYGISCGESIIL